MTLQSSGTISIGNVRTELNSTATLNLGASTSRSLAQIPSGAIKLSDFYGKTYIAPIGIVWTGSSGIPSVQNNTALYTGSQFIVAGTRGFYSPLGDSWAETSTLDTALGTNAAGAIISNGSTIVVGASNAGCASSTDNGLTWTARTSGFGTHIQSGEYAFGKFYFGGGTTTLAKCSYSTDGITWTGANTSFATAMSNKAPFIMCTNGSILIAAGYSPGSSYTTDGINWTSCSSLSSAFGTSSIRGMAYGNGIFVAIGDSAKCATSSDGINWTINTGLSSSITSAGKSINQMNKVCWTGNEFIAVGNAGLCSTSFDGINWTFQLSLWTYFANNTILAVAYGNGRAIAVGAAGKCAYSVG